ncbi:DUF1963 domain-containing protein [Bradyrhizobium iriomotense]|uniref:DUF1963 domain-containing protein n=1 Tax=Bradyrhizobium iriomotense TaxID=441950 RepID=UPI001B8A5E19|nr:DUF1963 domain-containing protein [Bradyrhizobium iriomotense]MBR0780652.1 DUF1963 domain-containing protein [Bradyrhizobium iriomotense]
MSFFKDSFSNPSRYRKVASDDDIRALLHGTAEESVAFKHQFPPRFPIGGRTYFGGLPTVPPDFRWPRAPGGTPFTFMAQVDCSELPDFTLRKSLPDSGVLHFFVNWDLFDGLLEAQCWPNQVVLSRAAEPWGEAAPPADLPPCYGAASAGYRFPWLRYSLGTYPRTFAKKAVTMGLLRNLAEECPPEVDDAWASRYQELWEHEQTAELARFYGDPVVAAELPQPTSGFPRTAIQRPTATFPAAWIDIEIFCGLLIKWLIETGARQLERGKHVGGSPWPSDPASVRAAYDDAATRSHAWVGQARSAGLMNAVPEADWTAFWSWLEEMNGATVDEIYDIRAGQRLNELLWEAVRASAHILLSAGEAASSLVPAEMMGELQMEHSVLVAGRWPRRAGRHQMRGAGRDVQGAPREALAVGDVLLLQLDSDWSVPWMMGDVGVLQYWISVSDLRAGRFDRVRVTLEGH